MSTLSVVPLYSRPFTSLRTEKLIEIYKPDVFCAGIKEKYGIQKRGVPLKQLHSYDSGGPYAGFKGAVYTPEGKTGGFDRYSLRRIRIQAGLSDKAWKFKISEAADTLRENPTLFGIKKALGQAFD